MRVGVGRGLYAVIRGLDKRDPGDPMLQQKTTQHQCSGTKKQTDTSDGLRAWTEKRSMINGDDHHMLS